MMNNLVLFSKVEAAIDRLAMEPYCALYLPLWKLDGSTEAGAHIYSQEAASKLFYTQATTWTPRGRNFTGGEKLYSYDDQGLDIEDAVTVELYLKPTANASASTYLLGKRYATFCLLSNTSYSLYFSVTTPGGTSEKYIGGTVPLGRFSLVSCSYDSADGKLRGYLNGLFVDSASHDYGGKICIDHDGYLRVGNHLEGIIALALYYSRALTPLEIAQHYQIISGLFT
jgi:hypothetical protein